VVNNALFGIYYSIMEGLEEAIVDVHTRSNKKKVAIVNKNNSNQTSKKASLSTLIQY
jgi:hypothetical protein